MMPTSFLIFYMWCAVIVSHELGHLISLRLFGTIEKVYFEGLDLVFDNLNLSKRVEVGVVVSGIVTGIIPLIIYFLYIPTHLIWIILFSMIYFAGCKWDLNELIKICLETKKPKV